MFREGAEITRGFDIHLVERPDPVGIVPAGGSYMDLARIHRPDRLENPASKPFCDIRSGATAKTSTVLMPSSENLLRFLAALDVA